MLGHKLAQILSPVAEVTVTVRDSSYSDWPHRIPVHDVIDQVDVQEIDRVASILDNLRPDVVLNAAGIVKQVMKSYEPAHALAVNALYPKLLSALCEARNIRLIHYSTDCVYSGAPLSERGPNGYRESDPPDAKDFYGISKLLGEPNGTTSLTLRTSIIGRELRRKSSLVEWFLAQSSAPVRGFTRALFSGLTTLELARVTAMILDDHPNLIGLWHIAADPIDKCTLLQLVSAGYSKRIEVQPTEDFFCDRRLDGTRFNKLTGWKAPPWSEMIQMMCHDVLDYEALAAAGENGITT